eukprot:Colp12_sorted_trinity150504_noHs@27909
MDYNLITPLVFVPNATCNPPVWHLGPVDIHNPLMIPMTLGGILTGFLGYRSIRNKNLEAAAMYAITYFIFGCMNTSGLLVHVFFPSKTFPGTPGTFSFFIGLIDGICSSCVSLSFVFCWLTDYKLFNVKKTLDRSILFSLYAAIAILYTLGSYGYWKNAFQVLYVDITRYGSLSYFVASILHMFLSRNFAGAGWLITSITGGLFGLNLLMPPRSTWICAHFPNWLNTQSIWYFFSDFSLFTLYKFYT